MSRGSATANVTTSEGKPDRDLMMTDGNPSTACSHVAARNESP